MMGVATHNIQKQVLEFKFSKTQAAKQWQQNVAFAGQERYVKMMETVLDRYDDGKNHLIDRLTIDLGNIDAAGETSHFERLFEEALNDYFSHRKGRKGNAVQIPKNRAGSPDRNSLLQGFVHFLEQGTLGWQDNFTSILELESRLKKELSPSVLSGYAALRSSLRKPLVRQRLYYQFSPSFSAEILKSHFKVEVELFQAIDKFIVHTLTELEKNVPLSTPKTEIPRILKTKIKEAGILKWISFDAPKKIQEWANAFLIWNLKRLRGTRISEAYETKFLALGPIQLSQQTQQEKLKSLLEEMLEETPKPKDQAPKGQKEADNYDDRPVPEKSNRKKQAKGKKSQKNEQKLSQAEKQGKRLEELPKERDSGTETSSKPDLPVGASEVTSKKPKIPADKNPFMAGGHEVSGQQSKNHKEPIAKARRKLENTEPENVDVKGTVFPKQDVEGSSSPSEKGAIPVSPPEEVEGGGPVSQNENVEELKAINDLDDFLQPDDAYYTDHSGIILTWPYLSKLFSKLKLTQDVRFKSKAHQQRAVCLLGYMATGETVFEEPDLIMAKFLCGWPIQMPIKKKIPLKKKELTEADAMLTGLIANWSILKNTSIAGLRETFFQREGKLFKEDGQWRLIVEQKSTDILLNHLPYTVAIIKLPWLKELVKVDWA